ncbi:hypothetical protein QR680_001909 [Steinernema hermaphroditum]|uniref:Large ribosomal subunit protein mL62 n=1 Tax=Steinernema hermaphroditum TaxID=289476 RepID=A0AA39H0E9_9BILA|nr:hypothetical protein QR680_001909 [Steinernema hermaphroditum]
MIRRIRVDSIRLSWISSAHNSTTASKYFNGHVPTDRIRKSFTLSGGPGGQHVNKVSTKAEIRFNIATADWLAPELREHFVKSCPQKVNKSNEVVIESSKTRSQSQNLDDCFDKLRTALLRCALDLEYQQRTPSESDVAILTKRAQDSVQRRLTEKRRLSDKKRERSTVF